MDYFEFESDNLLQMANMFIFINLNKGKDINMEKKQSEKKIEVWVREIVVVNMEVTEIMAGKMNTKEKFSTNRMAKRVKVLPLKTDA